MQGTQASLVHVRSRVLWTGRASSSRSQVTVRTARASACLTWVAPSVNVRWRPLLSVAIVAHLVTRLLSSRYAAGAG